MRICLCIYAHIPCVFIQIEIFWIKKYVIVTHFLSYSLAVIKLCAEYGLFSLLMDLSLHSLEAASLLSEIFSWNEINFRYCPSPFHVQWGVLIALLQSPQVCELCILHVFMCSWRIYMCILLYVCVIYVYILCSSITCAMECGNCSIIEPQVCIKTYINILLKTCSMYI